MPFRHAYCGTLGIFFPLRFYVKSLIAIITNDDVNVQRQVLNDWQIKEHIFERQSCHG